MKDNDHNQYQFDLSILQLAEALAHAQDLHTNQQRAISKSHESLKTIFDTLDGIERHIFDHKETFGVLNEEFQRGCEEFVLLASATAMLALQQQQHSQIQMQQHQHEPPPPLSSSRVATIVSPRSQTPPTTTIENEWEQWCGELLTRAEQHTRKSGYLRSLPHNLHVSHRLALRLTALNNLACFHHRGGRPWAAIGFLERALRLQLKQQQQVMTLTSSNSTGMPPSLEVFNRDTYAVALTRLNLAAVLSQLQRHSAAAEHAREAVLALRIDDPMMAEREGVTNDELLVVAYYNHAVELEHLGDRTQALSIFRLALSVASGRPSLLRMHLVRIIQQIVGEYETDAGVSMGWKSPSRWSQRGKHGAGTTAKAMDSPCGKQRPLSPRSLRQAET